MRSYLRGIGGALAITTIVAGFVLTESTPINAQTFSAQIQQFWNQLRTGALVFTHLRATDVTITGTCSGCGGGAASSVLAVDGTAPAPSIAFASEPGLGFFRSSAGVVTMEGSLLATTTLLTNGNVIGGAFIVSGGGSISVPAVDGQWVMTNNANTRGATFKVDALPTVGSGFGTSPAVIAGATPFAGSVNVGTGGTATSGVITWGGTAFPSTPVCTYSTTTTDAVTRGTPTTTQLTLNSTTAWAASDIVSWICISAK